MRLGNLREIRRELVVGDVLPGPLGRRLAAEPAPGDEHVDLVGGGIEDDAGPSVLHVQQLGSSDRLVLGPPFRLQQLGGCRAHKDRRIAALGGRLLHARARVIELVHLPGLGRRLTSSLQRRRRLCGDRPRALELARLLPAAEDAKIVFTARLVEHDQGARIDGSPELRALHGAEYRLAVDENEQSWSLTVEDPRRLILQGLGGRPLGLGLRDGQIGLQAIERDRHHGARKVPAQCRRVLTRLLGRAGKVHSRDLDLIERDEPVLPVDLGLRREPDDSVVLLGGRDRLNRHCGPSLDRVSLPLLDLGLIDGDDMAITDKLAWPGTITLRRGGWSGRSRRCGGLGAGGRGLASRGRRGRRAGRRGGLG